MASLATEASTWQRWKNSFRSSCTQERLGAPQLAAARHSLPQLATARQLRWWQGFVGAPLALGSASVPIRAQ